MMMSILLLCLVVFGAVAAVIVMRQWYEYRRRRDRRAGDELRCACGYVLRGTSLPRCPECGRAAGFDKTFEELGIRPEELRAMRATPLPRQAGDAGEVKEGG
jgi:hypothetical protein